MKRRVTAVLLTAVFAALVLAGCGSVKSGNGGNTAYYETETNYLPSPAEKTDAVNDRVESPSAMPDAQDPEGKSGVSLLDNSKIIYTANMRTETVEFDKSYQAMNDLVAEMGGYMERCSLSKNGAYRRVETVIRIPAEKYGEFMERGSELGQMLSLNEEKKDVTSSYYDIESRLKSARVKLERLQELMKQADYMGDLIELSNAISSAEYEIEYLQGDLNHLDARVA